MKQTFFCACLAVVITTAMASPADAANKEHQQLMADLRMLQEQSQLLQNLIGTVTDTLKAVNARLDQQSETNRKAFADQQLIITNLTNDVRVIREKLDDNNVRIGSLTQEVDSLRQSLQSVSAKVDSGKGTLGKLVNDDKLYQDVSEATANIKALIADIKAHPKKYFKVEIF